MKSIIFMLLAVAIINLKKCPVINAGQAKRYVGKEVILRDRMIRSGNSSYAQSAWFEVGKDTSHTLMVFIQGNLYQNQTAKTSIKNYIGKIIEVKGIVQNDKSVYLNATDTIKLSAVQY